MSHNDILVGSLSVGSFAGLPLEVSGCRCYDLYLYEPSELTMVFGPMCQNEPFDSKLAPSVVAHAALMIQDYIISD